MTQELRRYLLPLAKRLRKVSGRDFSADLRAHVCAGLFAMLFVSGAAWSATPTMATPSFPATTATFTPPPAYIPPSATFTSTPIALPPSTPATSTPTPAPIPASTPSSAPPASPAPAATSGSAPSFSPPAFNPSAVVRVDEEPAFEPGQLLVLWLSDQAAAQGIAQLQSRYQQRPRLRYSLPSLGFTLVMIALPTQREALALRDTLRAQQPEWVVDLNARSLPMQGPAPSSSTNTPDAAPRLYAVQMLGGAVASVQHAASAAPALRLGVIDTAFDPLLAQPQRLNGSQIIQRSVLAPIDKPADPLHGNAVLQLLASAAMANGFAGAAPPLTIAWVNVMREISGKARTNSLSLSLGLDWLVSQRVALINMSLGGQGDAVLKAVIERVLAKNIAVVAAAGNNPARDAPPVYPAAYTGVWAITAVDAAGRLFSGASKASYTLLAAPGVEVWVPGLPTQDATNSANTSGAYLSGSSYATALASAALAWQPAQFWDQSSEQRRALLCSQALKLAESAWLGCGLVQRVSSKSTP
jgi:hypothetical protein